MRILILAHQFEIFALEFFSRFFRTETTASFAEWSNVIFAVLINAVFFINFKFSRFNGSASNANYESTCEGTLQSYASKRYINWDDSNIIKFDLSNPDQNRILFIANRWKTDTTKDQYVDIYHNKDTGGKMIGRNKNNTKQVIWGNTGSGASFEFNSNDVRKWEFIEAIPQ